GPRALDKGVPDDAQDVVANPVAPAVVDRLELEDVDDEQERSRLAAARDGGQAPVLIVEGAATSQPGDRVGRVARQAAGGLVRAPGQRPPEPQAQTGRVL